MSRVEILQRSLKPSDAKVVTTLATLAREQLEAGNNQQAADLLRGAEHLSIAALTDQVSKKVQLSGELVQSITEHFNELTGKSGGALVEARRTTRRIHSDLQEYPQERNCGIQAWCILSGARVCTCD
jgi:hypothetical protein